MLCPSYSELWLIFIVYNTFFSAFLQVSLTVDGTHLFCRQKAQY